MEGGFFLIARGDTEQNGQRTKHVEIIGYDHEAGAAPADVLTARLYTKRRKDAERRVGMAGRRLQADHDAGRGRWSSLADLALRLSRAELAVGLTRSRVVAYLVNRAARPRRARPCGPQPGGRVTSED